MRIAIHFTNMHFSQGWIDYCTQHRIEYKLVNCYDTNIIKHLCDCDGLMWHHDHMSAKDTRFAKQLLYSLEMSGKPVYPDFRTNWHFDDKLGQKYLLEVIEAPMVASYAFYSREDAVSWAKVNTFPKVFKLRGGSASDNVKLMRTRKEALHTINMAFGRGFSQYFALGSLKERWRKFKTSLTGFRDVVKGVGRLFIQTHYSYVKGRERGYIYLQDFIPDNTHDIRVTYVNNRCFALRRRVRPGDFRASGSGMQDYDITKIPEKAVKIAFDVANRLNLQSAAFDFVLENGDPLITELSYGFGYAEEQFNHGYWDDALNFYPGTFNPFGWMVEGMIESINQKRASESNKGL